nr:MAG TPA: hypothetical protein [Caudoviricetes sp.]
MKTENYTGLSLDLIVRLLALLLVVTGMIALFASSCKSPQRMQNSYSQKDSLASKNGFVLLQEAVPPSIAKTKFPTGMLKLIPVGTGFSSRSGQATVNITRISEDSLEVTATCDSLARQVLILTEENTRIRDELMEEKKKPPPEVVREPTGLQWFQIWVGRLSLIYLAFRLLKRRFTKIL